MKLTLVSSAGYSQSYISGQEQLSCLNHQRKPTLLDRVIDGLGIENMAETYLMLEALVFCVFFLISFRFNVPVNNFSVMSGRSHCFLGITSTLVICVLIEHMNCIRTVQVKIILKHYIFVNLLTGL